tara:strand:+ start:405 stop:527 length:123 start_codon:yes stop_codon:yes gene_type:complete
VENAKGNKNAMINLILLADYKVVNIDLKEVSGFLEMDLAF